MTQKKINDFTLASNIDSTMQLETDIGGVTANKINISQLTSYFGDNISYFSPQQVIYVAKNGDDTTGDGTFLNPFLTIAKANSVILDAATSKRYVVFIHAGRYDESSNILLKPYVGYVGYGSSFSYITSPNNQIGPDSLYNNANGRSSLVNIYVGGSTGINFDLSTKGTAGSCILEMYNCGINGGITYIGRDLGADFIQLFDTYALGSWQFSNCQAEILSGFCGGDLTYDTATTSGHSIGTIQNFQFGANVSIVSTGSIGNTLQIIGSNILGALDVSGSTTTLNIDSISFPTSSSNYSVSGGATVNKTTSSYSINYLSATASLNFGSVSANSTSDLTISLTGATVGDTVVLGAPVVASGIMFSAFVSSSNTVTVRAANITSSPISLSSSSFTVKII